MQTKTNFEDLKKICPYGINKRVVKLGDIKCYHKNNPDIKCTEKMCPVINELVRIYEKKNS